MVANLFQSAGVNPEEFFAMEVGFSNPPKRLALEHKIATVCGIVQFQRVVELAEGKKLISYAAQRPSMCSCLFYFVLLRGRGLQRQRESSSRRWN
jgi:hypothetical protein